MLMPFRKRFSTNIDHGSCYKCLTEFLLTLESNTRNNEAKIDQTKKVEGCEIYIMGGLRNLISQGKIK